MAAVRIMNEVGIVGGSAMNKQSDEASNQV